MIVLFVLTLIGVLALYFIVLKPLVPILQIKFKFGNAAMVEYFPLIGNLRKFNSGLKQHNDFFHHFKFINSGQNPYIKFRLSNLLSTVMIGITDPEYYKQVLTDHNNYDKFDVIGHNQLMANGLLYTEGEKWSRQRKLFGNSFHNDALKARIPMINRVVEQHLQAPDPMIIRFMGNITGNVVAKSFFSDDIDGLILNGVPMHEEIVRIFNDLGELQNYNMVIFLKQVIFGQRSWRIFPSAKERDVEERIFNLRLQCEKLIQARIAQTQLGEDGRGESSKMKNDFLDLYIQAYFETQLSSAPNPERKITLDQIIQQFITLSFAGTDTTANLCAISLYYMAEHQQDQQELYEEVMSIRSEGDYTDEDLKKMEKLTAFINEVLRVRNPAICPIMRRAKQDHYIKDLYVKRGWYINIDNFIPQLSGQYYDDHLKFDYRRWLNNNPIKNNNQFVFVPFSAGPRNCIGQHMAQIEAKIILARTLRKFKSVLKPGVRVQWVTLFLYTFSPEDAVVLQPRDTSEAK